MGIPSITTLICTMNRPDDLSAALASLAACVPGPGQVIVSDDSPADDRRSEAVCERYAVEYRRGPRSGLGANRNTAVRGVAGEWVHFIDDDVTVPADFYATAAEAIRGAGGRAVVCGVEMKHVSREDHSPIRVTPPRSGFWAHLEDPAGRPANCVVINAALFPTELLRRTPFDARMKYGCEESDISCHAVAQGYRLVFDPRLCVDHFPSPQNRSVYDGWVVASQVYAGLKRQWFYERSRARAAAFLLLAVPRLVVYHTRRGGPAAGLSAVRQTARGLGYFGQLLRERRRAGETASSE